MGLHQIKKILYNKENNYQNKESAHRMREIFAIYSSDKITYSIYKELNNSTPRKQTTN
jgi:hypothetical protein